MSELLQEYVDSGSQRLRVDRTAGVIRGVKLLGLNSRNGRRYRENALTDAIALYEGAKVNINHPKGHPLSPRDYQDRLGVVRGVEFRAGEGLFGDLHFNSQAFTFGATRLGCRARSAKRRHVAQCARSHQARGRGNRRRGNYKGSKHRPGGRSGNNQRFIRACGSRFHSHFVGHANARKAEASLSRAHRRS